MKDKETIIKNILVFINIVIFYYLLFAGRNQYFYNMSYLKSVLFMIINSIFIYSYGILKDEKKSYDSNILIYIALYSYLLFAFVFIISRPEIRFYNWCYAWQYIPFNTIISQIKYGTTYSILKNIIGNAIALIPLSFLLMVKSKKFNNIFWQLLIILPCIIIIELLQAFTHTGSFDIDDIILNYIGTLIFTILITRFNMIGKIRNLFYKDFKLKSSSKSKLFYTCLSLLVLFDIIIFMRIL